MAPVKFDDLKKTAHDVLDGDYKTSGFEIKSKNKTSWNGAVVDTVINADKVGGAQSAKLSWKLPKHLGSTGISIDKFEIDKAGKLKLEASKSDQLPADLKIDAKSDCADVNNTVVGFTFTGVKDTQLKFETKATNPQAFTFEATRQQGPAMLGIKCGMANLQAPDVGARFTQGPLFVSLLAQEKFSAVTAHTFYKLNNQLKLAATYQHGGKKNGNFSAGIAYDLGSGINVKVKAMQDTSINASVKYELSKGLTLVGGGAYNPNGGKFDYGLQVSIE